MRKKWTDMTDREAKEAIGNILLCHRFSEFENDEIAGKEMEDLIKSTFGISCVSVMNNYTTFIGESAMRMFIARLCGPSGRTITV